MAEALQQLGVNMTVDWNEKEMVVTGCRGRFPSKGADLYLGNAGTAMRSDPFLDQFPGWPQTSHCSGPV